MHHAIDLHTDKKARRSSERFQEFLGAEGYDVPLDVLKRGLAYDPDSMEFSASEDGKTSPGVKSPTVNNDEAYASCITAFYARQLGDLWTEWNAKTAGFGCEVSEKALALLNGERHSLGQLDNTFLVPEIADCLQDAPPEVCREIWEFCFSYLVGFCDYSQEEAEEHSKSILNHNRPHEWLASA